MDRKDACTWLREKNTHYIGSRKWGGDEDTNNDSLKIVAKLDQKGASKVEVDIYDKEDDYACSMLVTLPEEVEQIIDVLCYIGELHADEITEKDGVANVIWGD